MYEFIFGFSILFQSNFMSAATILFNTGLYTESGGRKYTGPTCFFFLSFKKDFDYSGDPLLFPYEF